MESQAVFQAKTQAKIFLLNCPPGGRRAEQAEAGRGPGHHRHFGAGAHAGPPHHRRVQGKAEFLYCTRSFITSL